VVRARNCDRHQTPHVQRVEGPHLGSEAQHIVGGQAKLGRLPRGVHFDEHVEAASQRLQPAIEVGRQLQRVERLELGDPLDRASRLVRLQWPDQGELDPQCGIKQFGLSHQLLDPVLTEPVDAGRVCGHQRLDRMGLAHRQQPHLGRVASGPFAGGRDAASHGGDVRRDHVRRRSVRLVVRQLAHGHLAAKEMTPKPAITLSASASSANRSVTSVSISSYPTDRASVS